MKTKFPRLCILTLNTSSELAIDNAMKEVEKLEPCPILTDAVMHLASAKELVGKYIDNAIKETYQTETHAE